MASIKIKTLSQLPEVSSANLPTDSFFEADVPVAISTDLARRTVDPPVYVYASKKISRNELADNLGKAIRSTLCADTGIPADSSKNFGAFYDETTKKLAGVSFVGTNLSLSSNPIIRSDEISDFNSTTNYVVSLSSLRSYVNMNAAPALGPNYGFVTDLSNLQESHRYETLFNIDVNQKAVYDAPRYVFSPELAKTISENEFVFKINPGERKSKVWTAPASGIFTCYGWLDEVHSDSISNEKRWVALLGYQKDLEVWTTLQVQPFIKNDYLSYVSFTFPVKKGMQLMVQTGFAVGSNSGKYFRSSASLANHIPNAFLGGVYTGLSVDFSSLALTGDYSYSPDPRLLEISSQVQDLISSEVCCDLSTNERIDALEQNSVTSAEIESLSSRSVKYIDAAALSGRDPLTYSAIKFGEGHECGVFNPAILQESHINGAVKKYKCLSVDFTLNQRTPFGMKSYYAPPTIPEIRDDRIGYIEKACFYEELSAGYVASDGKYFYYRTTQDCTLLIKFSHDAMNGRNTIKGWLLYDTARSYYDVKALPILEKVEMGRFNGYPSESIAVPVKANTVVMFGLYGREKIPDCPWYVENLQPPVLTEKNNIVPTTLDDLRTDPQYETFVYGHYANLTRTDISCTSYLIYADGSNIGNLVSTSPTSRQQSFDETSYGCVGYVYELP